MGLNAKIVAGFSKSILASRYDSPQPTPDFHHTLWKMCTLEHQFVAIAAPRGSAKSTAVTHAYGLAEALFRESQFIVIASRTEAQGADFLNDMKIEIDENEDLRSYFKIKRMSRATTTDLIVECQDGYTFRILVMTIDSYKRGTKWRNMRPSLILLDDAEGDEQVMNQDRREKFARQVDGAIIPSLSDNGKLRMVGTIMHEDSYLENLMPNKKDPNTVISEDGLSMINITDDAMWASAKFKAHPSVSNFTKLLWPEKLTKKKLMRYRDAFKKRGLLDVYSQEYLNDPIDESAAYFRAPDFFEMDAADRSKSKRYYAACDLAISTNTRADYTAIVVVGVDQDGWLYVVDVRRFRGEMDVILDEMFSVQERYDPELFGIEGGVIQKAISPTLNSEMGSPRRRGMYLNVEIMPPIGDKKARGRSFQARMKAGKVKFDKEAPWYDDLEHEMLRFPKGTHDDQVDGLSYIGLMLDKLIEADSFEEIFEQEYNAEFGGFSFAGQSKVTGY